MSNPDKRKLKAFTLMEISVTLMLSFIVIGMLYLALEIITKQIKMPQKEKTEDIALLKLALNNAFFNATKIGYNTASLILTCQDSSLVNQFQFNNKGILKVTAGRTDTLYQGSFLLEIEHIKETGLVGHLLVKIPVKSDTMVVFCRKNYSPATLMNHKNISFEY